MAKPTKSAIEAAMRDGQREGCPFDTVELAAEFGITVGEVEQILSSGQPTVAKAKKFAATCGCTLRVTEDKQYRVNYKGGSEATAYYTDDLEDAMDTAAAMENNLVNRD